MRIASLFLTARLEDYALSACREAKVELVCFKDIASLGAALQQQNYDALIMGDDDQALASWLQAIRLKAGGSLVITVFGSGGAINMARALQYGADDYATHNEGPVALLERVEARLQQRLQGKQRKRLQAGTCSLDANSRSLKHQQTEISLTAREFALAWTLFDNAGQVVSYCTLSNEIWGRSKDIGKRTIEQHVYKLRRKIKDAAGDLSLMPQIQAVYGVGYRLQVGE